MTAEKQEDDATKGAAAIEGAIRDAADAIRRSLDELNFYEGTARREGCIAGHVRGVVARAVEADRAARREPDAARPVTWAREAEIRKEVGMFAEQENRDYGELLVTTEMMVDSLALLDHERHGRGVDVAILTDALTGDGRYDAGYAAGVAAALAEVQRLLRHYQTLPLQSIDIDRLRRELFMRGIQASIDVIHNECGPAPLPPHLVTLAECARMRAALAEIAGPTEQGDAGVLAVRIAREALEGTPP